MATEQERTFEVPPDACHEVGEILARINDKWSIRILRQLRIRTQRFNELQRELGGVTHKMLTQTLRGLERDGIVARLVTPTVPPRVDYELTPLGLTALAAIDVVARWALEHRPAILAARAAYDAT
jgi:DNA-binding HxlR family transcriptional regulator